MMMVNTRILQQEFDYFTPKSAQETISLLSKYGSVRKIRRWWKFFAAVRCRSPGRRGVCPAYRAVRARASSSAMLDRYRSLRLKQKAREFKELTENEVDRLQQLYAECFREAAGGAGGQ